jgi:hypothetical protein
VTSDRIEVTIAGLVQKVERVRLGSYLKLQRAAKHLSEAAAQADTGAIAEALFEYLKACIPDLDRGEFNEAPWYEVISAFQSLRQLNSIRGAENFSMLTNAAPNDGKTVAWDHDERHVLIWIHTIANAYKWAKAEIENLWPEEAIGYIQEILAEDQLEKEFLYSLSEIAYPYDKATKKSKFKPMQRPLWMVAGGGRKNDRVLKSMLPVGNVVYPEDDERFKDVVH